MVDFTKKGQTREEDRYIWGFGLRPSPHIYTSTLLDGIFFSALMTFYQIYLPALLETSYISEIFLISSLAYWHIHSTCFPTVGVRDPYPDKRGNYSHFSSFQWYEINTDYLHI